MLVSSGSICAVCNEEKSGYNAVILPCGHLSCANCVVESEREGRIDCNMCLEAFYHRASQPRAREVFVEPAGVAQLQAQVIALERNLDEEKCARKEFESDLLRQLLKISIKEEERGQREVEMLRAEIGVMKNTLSMYHQRLDEVRKKCAAVEQRCMSLENEMKATKAQGDQELSRLQEALKQERRRAYTRNSEGLSGSGSINNDFKVEDNFQTGNALRTAPRGSRAPDSSIKPEESHVAAKPVVRDIAVESRQAVVTDGRRGRVFKFVTVAPMNTAGSDTGTEPETELGVKPSERSILPLPARKAPEVSLPARAAKIPSVPATPVSTKPEAAPAPKKPELKRGAEIKWTGYGCPQHTAVPECTDKSGVHNFSGSGTNQYMRKFTCRGCRFSCSERW